MITKDRLKKFEHSFKEAKADYYSALPVEDVQELKEISSELGFKLENKSCSRCILNMLKFLAKQYDEMLDIETTTTPKRKYKSKNQ